MENYTDLSLRHSNPPDMVYSAFCKQDKTNYIIKMVKHDSREDSNLLPQLVAYKLIQHQNCVTLKEYFNHFHNKAWFTALVLEFCMQGTIDVIINDDDKSQIDMLGVMSLLAKGVQHLHQKGIVHRDIKPDNVFVSRGKPKLADFGLAKVIKEGQQLQDNVGTMFYASPEMTEEKSYGLKTDIWSLGLVFLELATGERASSLVKGMRPPCLKKSFPSKDLLERVTNRQVSRLIKHMLNKKPEKRPTILQVREKLEKITKKSNRTLVPKQKTFELSMIQGQVTSKAGTENEEESCALRVDPNRDRQVRKYKKIIENEATGEMDECVFKYDDYNEQFWMKFQEFSVHYTFKLLPESVKITFPDMLDFVNQLRKNTCHLFFTKDKKMIVKCCLKEEAELQFFKEIVQSREGDRIRRVDLSRYFDNNQSSIQNSSLMSHISAKSEEDKSEKESDSDIRSETRSYQESNDIFSQFMRERFQDMRSHQNMTRQRFQNESAANQLALMVYPDDSNDILEREQSYGVTGSRKPHREDQAKILKKQIQLLELVQGPERSQLLHLYPKLAKCYVHCQQVEEAIRTHQQATQKFKEYHYYKSEVCANNLQKLAKIYLFQDKEDQALRYFEEAQQIYRALKSNNAGKMSLNENEIGRIHLLRQNLTEAEHHFVMAIELTRSKFGQIDCYEKQYKADPFANIGHVRFHQQNHEEALSIFQQSIEIFTRNPNLRIINPLRGIININFAGNKVEEAISLMEQMFSIGRNICRFKQVKIDLTKWVEKVVESRQQIGERLIVKMLQIIKQHAPDQKDLIRVLS